MPHLHAVACTLALLPAVGAAQQKVPVGADVRIVTMAGRVIRGRVMTEDSVTLAVWPQDANGTWSPVTTLRDSVALLEIREPGRFRPGYLLMGAAAGAAGGGMMGATVAWMECPFGQDFLCSDRGRRDQRRTTTTGAEIGIVAGVVAGFFFRPGQWQSVPGTRLRPTVTGLSRGTGLGLQASF